MSQPARTLLIYRYWLDHMESLPRSSYVDREIFLTESKLRAQAAHVIGWGC